VDGVAATAELSEGAVGGAATSAGETGEGVAWGVRLTDEAAGCCGEGAAAGLVGGVETL
jgi:hypothetical protein